MKIFAKSSEAATSKGFIKAFLYSSISAILGVALVFLAKPEATTEFGKYAIFIPLINSFLVFLKQLADAYKEGA